MKSYKFNGLCKNINHQPDIGVKDVMRRIIETQNLIENKSGNEYEE